MVLLGFIGANAAASIIVVVVGIAVLLPQQRDLVSDDGYRLFRSLVPYWAVVAALTFYVGVRFVSVPALVLIVIAETNNVFRSLFANVLAGGVLGLVCGLIVVNVYDAADLLPGGPIFMGALGLGAGVAAGMVYWRIAGRGPRRGPSKPGDHAGGATEVRAVKGSLGGARPRARSIPQSSIPGCDAWHACAAPPDRPLFGCNRRKPRFSRFLCDHEAQLSARGATGRPRRGGERQRLSETEGATGGLCENPDRHRRG